MRRRLFRSASQDGPKRPYCPHVHGLEERHLMSTLVPSLVATPSVLSPPDNRYVEVVITGAVVESRKGAAPNVAFHVDDEYRRFEPRGKVVLTRLAPQVLTYKFSIFFPANRSDRDQSGRQYYVTVGSKDEENANGRTVPVFVPHDALKPGETIPPYSVSHPSLPDKDLPPISGNLKKSPTSGLPSLGDLFGGFKKKK